MIRTYSDLRRIPTFLERFAYLKVGGYRNQQHFYEQRKLNQDLYGSKEWKRVRRDVILRDMGMDLGVDGHEVGGKIIVHHMNPITVDDILSRSELVWNPEYLITTSFDTHEAIHYSELYVPQSITGVERRHNDTCPWKEG